VSGNSRLIQVLIKLCWTLSKLKLVPWQTSRNYAVLFFDELAITKNVSYNLEHNEMEGLEDSDIGKCKYVAS